jgi:diacylglycerol kinase (ATP)
MGNGCYTGGGLKQTPEAVPTDGLLDIMVVENLNLIKILKAIPLLFKGKLLEHKSVHLYKAKKIKVKSEKPIISEVDGILQGLTNEIEVELLPKQINFIS